jgi:hypothetical protein
MGRRTEERRVNGLGDMYLYFYVCYWNYICLALIPMLA